MPKGTKIASVEVGNKTVEEMRGLLDTEITLWKAGDDLILHSEFEEFIVSREIFQFDVEASISELKQKTKRTLSTFFKRPQNVQIPLHVTIDETHEAVQDLKSLDYIDTEDIWNKLALLASGLNHHEIVISYKDGARPPLEEIAATELTVPNLSEATLQYMIEQVNGYVIKAGELYSFLNSFDSPQRLLNSKEEASFIGSGLYSLFLQANMQIIDRNTPMSMPEYGEKGFHVEINQRENKDLIIHNDTDYTYQIKVKRTGNTVQFIIEGKKLDFTYEIEMENEKDLPFKTLYRYSKKLKLGEEQVIQEGENGLTIDVFRTVYDKGVYMETELISKDLYLPTPKILLVSTEDIVAENEQTDSNNSLNDPDGLGNIGGIPGLPHVPGVVPGGVDQVGPPLTNEEDLKEAEERIEKQLNDLFDKFFADTEKMNTALITEQEAIKARLHLLETQIQELIKQLIEIGLLTDKEGEKR